jgi:hypothetical protein
VLEARGVSGGIGGGGDRQGGFRKTVTMREDADIVGLLTVITDNWTRIARRHGLDELPKPVFNVQVTNTQVNIFDQLFNALYPANGAPAAEETGNQKCVPAGVR